MGRELADFDQATTDLLVRHTVGEVPASVRLLLDLVAPGVKLTPSGRLPRAVVRQVQEQRPHWYLLDRPAHIEDDLPPLAALHGLLRKVGLLRLRAGVLSPTRAAGDDLETVRRLRSWFVPEEFTDILVGVTVAVLASRGPQGMDELAANVYALLGSGWAHNGEPLTEFDIRMEIAHVSAVLKGLDLIETDWPHWRAGPSARTLLPRATGLAQLGDRAAPADWA